MGANAHDREQWAEGRYPILRVGGAGEAGGHRVGELPYLLSHRGPQERKRQHPSQASKGTSVLEVYSLYIGGYLMILKKNYQKWE